MSSTYFFDNAWPEERARIAALEAALDPGTQALLEARAPGAGWRCLEIGAGGGSIAAWLAGHDGVHVLATDIQTSFVKPLAHDRLEVRAHDITSEGLPPDTFDLEHVRWMLFWLAPAARDAALRQIVAAMRPGGWLLAEEPDLLPMLSSPTVPEPLRSVNAAHVALIEKISGQVDPRYGSTLLRDLTEHGLIDMSSAGRTHVIRPGDPATGSSWLGLALGRVRQPLVDSGACTDAEFDRAVKQFDDPATTMLFPLTMAVWGRRPA